jgi:hypothetical protein
MSGTGQPSWLGHLLDIGELRDYPTQEDVNRPALCNTLPSNGWGSLSKTPDQDGLGRICMLCQSTRDNLEKPAEPAYVISTITRHRLEDLRLALTQICACPAGPVYQIAFDALKADDTAAAKSDEQANAMVVGFLRTVGWPLAEDSKTAATFIPVSLDPLQAASELPEGMVGLEAADRLTPDTKANQP